MNLLAEFVDVAFSVITLVDASLPNVHCVIPKLAHRRSQSLPCGILDAKRHAEAGHHDEVLISHHAGDEGTKQFRIIFVAAILYGFPFPVCLGCTELDGLRRRDRR